MNKWKLGSLTVFCTAFVMFSGLFSFACAKTHINIALYDIDVSLDERQRLQALLEPFFTAEVSVISDAYIATSIQLTTAKGISDQWYRSRYQLPSLPGFALFSFEDGSAEQGVTAVLQRPYTIVTDGIAYPVTSKEAAITMLFGHRVDGIIDYSANVALYKVDNRVLNYQILREETPLFIEFSSMTERHSFEQLVSAAEQKDDSIPFFNDPSAHGDSTQIPINFFVLNKLFDDATKKLLPLSEEINAVKWWADYLPEYNVRLEYASSSEALSAMSSAENICILNIYKNPEREELAHFSKPAVFYLNARLYALAYSENAQKLKNIVKEKPVNLSHWLYQQKESVIGYSNLALTNIGGVPKDIYTNNQRFINLDELPLERVVELLKRNRIDFIIDYPTRLKQARAQAGDTSPLISVEIENVNESSAAYIACSRSTIGASAIKSINRILSEPNKMQPLIDLYTKGFSTSEIEKYTRDALQVH